jgi:hypothetical protein
MEASGHSISLPRRTIAIVALGMCCALIGWSVLHATRTVHGFLHEFFGRTYAPLPTSVHVPPGFKRMTCPAFRSPGLCFTQRRSLILNPHSAASLARAAGVPVTQNAVRCLFSQRRARASRRFANSCVATAEIANRKVILWITSVFIIGPRTESSVTTKTGPFPPFWVAIQSFGNGPCRTPSLHTCSAGQPERAV